MKRRIWTRKTMGTRNLTSITQVQATLKATVNSTKTIKICSRIVSRQVVL